MDHAVGTDPRDRPDGFQHRFREPRLARIDAQGRPARERVEAAHDAIRDGCRHQLDRDHGPHPDHHGRDRVQHVSEMLPAAVPADRSEQVIHVSLTTEASSPRAIPRKTPASTRTPA